MVRLSWRRSVAVLFAITAPAFVFSHSLARDPLAYVSTIENATIQTASGRVHSYSHFDLTFDLHHHTSSFRLILEPNQDIIAEGASVQFLDSDGQLYHSEPIDRRHHRIFKGDVWQRDVGDDQWFPVGWARISIRRDGFNPIFEGAFTVGRDHHHVQMHSTYAATKHDLDPSAEDTGDEYMILFRDSDIRPATDLNPSELKRSLQSSEHSCRSDQLLFNANPTQTVLKRETGYWGSMPLSSLLGKRQIDGSGRFKGGNSGSVNLKDSIGVTQGCPSTRKVALIGVATDCAYTGSFNSSETARANVIQQVAAASSVYEKTFNITLGLQNLIVSDASCPGTPPAATPWNQGCSSNLTITDRLNSFSTWRAQRKDTNAYWTLLTNCRTESEVGLAWLGQLCVGEATANGGEVVSGANVVAKTSTEWQVLAHETGHTFGAVHDCDTQTCASSQIVNAQQCCPLSSDTCDAGSRYIMNPSSGDGITSFSPCSIGNICSALGRNSVKSTCLSDNKGVTVITGHQCGNGIVEEGEDCDCGGEDNCSSNNCCDAKTCKFKQTAVCDDANEACCRNCQFAASGTVCRASTGVCDPEETCPGTNSSCPVDQTAPNGQSCIPSSNITATTGGIFQCASGQCTSRNQQCKTLMGSFTSNNDTYACDSRDCVLSCAAPEFGSGVCYSLQQNFLDGTTCGGGGQCSNGLCSGSSTAKEIGTWIQDNRNLVIGIASAVGALILFAILSCLTRRCRRNRRQQRIQQQRQAMHAHQRPGVMPSVTGPGLGYPPPPPAYMSGAMGMPAQRNMPPPWYPNAHTNANGTAQVRYA